MLKMLIRPIFDEAHHERREIIFRALRKMINGKELRETLELMERLVE